MQAPARPRRRHRRTYTIEELGPHYKWIALSNTTLGMLMATINSSIVLIALPDIFRGIHINPLEPANTSYLLWMMMGFIVVTAVLVVGFGRLGDMYGRVRMYNLGFAVFSISSVLLAVTWMDGGAAATWMIAWRIIQGIGGAFLMANSSAILTDAFPVHQRGTALGINGVAAIAGSFLGLIIGGVLGPVDWRLVFLVSVPFGVFGTIWAYLKLHDTSQRQQAKMDWWGNVTFAIGLIAVLVGITYGLQPYGGSSMGWGNPFVLGCIIGGVVLLVVFGFIETKVSNPLFHLGLFKIRAFALGNIANLLASLGRGGLQFILIIWLQGIWLPQHGYSFEKTPLWAGIYMLPMTIGFLLSAPTSGIISDRIGGRALACSGMLLTAVSFVLLLILPVNFNYWPFAFILLLNGLGMGLFASPNRADIMNSLPVNARGAGAGMTATFQNSAMVLSIGFFFSLMIAGLANHLPSAMQQGLVAHGVPADSAANIANLPAVGVLFAAFLGYNPIQQLLGNTLTQLPPDQASYLTGRSFFPQLISAPFSDGLTAAFWFAFAVCVIAGIASWLVGKPKPAAAVPAKPQETTGSELAAAAGELVNAAPNEPVHAAPREPKETPVGKPGTVSGRLRTPEGRGVAGVITVTGLDGRQVARAKTDPTGSYQVGGLGSGVYTLIVTAPGFHPEAASVRLNGYGAVHDFVVTSDAPKTVTLHGTVSGPDGRPLAGATVTVNDGDGQPLAEAVSGPDGEYRIPDLAPGEYTVVTSLYEPALRQVELGAGESVTVDVDLATRTREDAQP